VLKVSRILKDYDRAGSVNTLLAPWGFVDNDMFMTKAGHLGVVYRVAGVDYECLDPSQRRDIVHRFEAAIRLLDDTCRVYQYLSKRRIAPIAARPCRHAVVQAAVQQRADYLNSRRAELYEIDLHLVVLNEGLHPAGTTSRLRGLCTNPRLALRHWLSSSAVCALIDADLTRAIVEFHQKTHAVEAQLADTIAPRRLTKQEAFAFLRRLVNDADHRDSVAGLAYDTHVDYFMADSHIECHRDHLDVGRATVKVLTMKEPPNATFAHLLEDLYTVPGEFTACVEWRRLSNEQMRHQLHARRRHFFNKRVSLINYASSDTRPEEMLVDESAGATVRQLGDALTELEVNGHFFGETSLTVVMYDTDPRVVDQAVAQAKKAIASHDGVFIDESYNLLNAWLSIVPGNSAHNVRRLALLETNYADLSFLFTLNRGEPVSRHLRQEALGVFETRHQTPFHFNLHVDDVGHTVVLGATGSGKSFLLNFLITHAQKYEPATVIFDLGHSYRKLATLLHGSFLELGLRECTVTINPFALMPTQENLHFLHAFLRVLLEGADTYRLSDAEDRELYEAIENLYVLDRPQRRLLTLAHLLPRALSARLSKWVDGGRYAALFDNVEDTLSVQRFQVFEFEAMRAYPALLEPLLFYVLHRVHCSITDADDTARLKVCVMDEAWRFIQHGRLRAYVEEALKTWRKRNGAMIVATQSIDDFASADLLRTVVESCPTKLLLANPALDRTRYRELFQLNDAELALLVDLMPRRQLLLKRPDIAKVLTLNVDARSYWLYTNTPIDNEKVAAMCREHGFDRALDRLAASA
jgi:type IV secretion/conjugal transfer VirB4 family ATPase